MSIGPVLLDLDSVTKPFKSIVIERFIILAKFLISACEIEYGCLMILVELKCLLVAVKCIFILLHLV